MYEGLLKTSFIFDIYLVPPQSGQFFPVILLYIHVVNIGEILLIRFAKIGKKITYIDNNNIVIFKYM